MHLPISIHDHKLLALLDSGLTLNFINTGVVCRIELVTGACNLLATVVNGDNVAYTSVARNVAMCIGRDDFLINCFGIKLGGFDLVLGVDYPKLQKG